MEYISHGQNRSAPLDGIRGFAVLLVFLSHSSGRSLYPSTYLQFQGVGHVGVYLFCVLSSWLLTSKMLDELTDEKVRIPEYFIKRFLRIYPLYFVVVTGVFLVQQVFRSYTTKFLFVSEGVTGYLKHIFLLKGDSVFWTIPVEVSYYILIPLVAYFIHHYRWMAIALISAIAAVFSYWTEVLFPSTDYALSFYPKVVDILHKSQFAEVFLIGSIFAGVNFLMPRGVPLLRRIARFVDWGAFAIFVVLMAFTAVFVCSGSRVKCNVNRVLE